MSHSWFPLRIKNLLHDPSGPIWIFLGLLLRARIESTNHPIQVVDGFSFGIFSEPPGRMHASPCKHFIQNWFAMLLSQKSNQNVLLSRSRQRTRIVAEILCASEMWSCVAPICKLPAVGRFRQSNARCSIMFEASAVCSMTSVTKSKKINSIWGQAAVEFAVCFAQTPPQQLSATFCWLCHIGPVSMGAMGNFNFCRQPKAMKLLWVNVPKFLSVPSKNPDQQETKHRVPSQTCSRASASGFCPAPAELGTGSLRGSKPASFADFKL